MKTRLASALLHSESMCVHAIARRAGEALSRAMATDPQRVELAG